GSVASAHSLSTAPSPSQGRTADGTWSPTYSWPTSRSSPDWDGHRWANPRSTSDCRTSRCLSPCPPPRRVRPSRVPSLAGAPEVVTGPVAATSVLQSRHRGRCEVEHGGLPAPRRQRQQTRVVDSNDDGGLQTSPMEGRQDLVVSPGRRAQQEGVCREAGEPRGHRHI